MFFADKSTQSCCSSGNLIKLRLVPPATIPANAQPPVIQTTTREPSIVRNNNPISIDSAWSSKGYKIEIEAGRGYRFWSTCGLWPCPREKREVQSLMTERPRIVLSPWIKGEPLRYTCSLCGRTFIFPEDRSPKEGMAEVLTAFDEHVREAHPEGGGTATTQQS